MFRLAFVSFLLALGLAAAGTVAVDAHGHSRTYQVRWGDTLWGIAHRHGASVDAIMLANALSSDRIYAGQTLRLPGGLPDGPGPVVPGGLVYTVRWGDALWSIARRYGTTIEAIMRANGLRTYRIYAGQRLFVPIGAPRPMPTPVPHMPEVFLSPWSGPPGTAVNLRAVGFAPWSAVQIGVGPYGSEFSPVMTVTADGSGTAFAHFTADAAAGVNLVCAARAVDTPNVYGSALFRVR